MTNLPSDELDGALLKDPLAEVGEGGELWCEARLFPARDLEPKRSFDWAEFDGVMTAVAMVNSEKCWCYGSAVQIAPGIAFAAKHVVWPEAGKLYMGQRSSICVAQTNWGLDVWGVHGFFGGHCDVATLTQVRQSPMLPDGPICHAMVSRRMPLVGEPVALLGFVASQPEFPLIDVKGTPHLRFGYVIDCYPQGRDAQLPGPCFAVAIGASGGMSGGPAFDERGRLVGIVSSSIEDGIEGVAFVSMLIPALSRQVHPVWPRQLGLERQRLDHLLARFEALAD